MIKEIRLQNFKQYRDETFAFRSSGITLLAGGNNSGKSTLLQGLAVWEFCRALIEATKGRAALNAGARRDPVGLSMEEFSPMALPSLSHLWNNLNSNAAIGGALSDRSFTLRIAVKWDVEAQFIEGQPIAPPIEHSLEIGLKLSHDRIFVKPTHSTLHQTTNIPRFAYLPPFAGIQSREERMSPAAQKRLIGRGLAGATLRNVLHDLHQRSLQEFSNLRRNRKRVPITERQLFYRRDPWSQLAGVLERVFKAGLTVQAFNELYQTALHVDLFRGDLVAGRFKKLPKFHPHDIMVEGSGFLQWLSVYALMVSPEINVLLLDEPDAHLHPTLQVYLLDLLRALAIENKKQALLATHSTTILSEQRLEQIFRMEDRVYLVDERARVALFVGLGSQYAPRLDQLKRTKRLFLHDGPSDLEVLKILGTKQGIAWPANLVCWKYTKDRAAREILFEELRAEIPGLKCISLQDRDDYPFPNTKPDLTFDNLLPFVKGLGLRRWRRRNLENHLLHPAAIARACGQTEAQVREFLQDTHGLAIPATFIESDCPQTLANTDGKAIVTSAVNSLTVRFGVSYKQIAEAMQVEEIPVDASTLIGQLVELCRS